jgi:PTH1 family peptidyl-tRNA hydrolase
LAERHLLVGLGNPGREYRNNRHNVGFLVLDRLVARQGWAGFTRRQGKALITTGALSGTPLVLAKPQTYMNLSGQAVASLARFYDLTRERLLVILDDIDLPLGMLRMRPEGGSGGQGGLKSIITSLGTEAFPRLRVGIGRPPGVRAAAGYVLRDFQPDERELIDLALDRAVDAAECFVLEGLTTAMNRYNGPADRL